MIFRCEHKFKSISINGFKSKYNYYLRINHDIDFLYYNKEHSFEIVLQKF